jgi:hypothetical protein
MNQQVLIEPETQEAWSRNLSTLLKQPSYTPASRLLDKVSEDDYAAPLDPVFKALGVR